MAETKIYIDDHVDKRLREAAMIRFGYGRGSISNAVEEAIVQWLRREAIIKKRLDAIANFAKKDKNTIAVIVFGSYARKERDYVDIDVAVLVEKPQANIHALANYIPLSEDYRDKIFDIVMLNGLPLDVQRKVLNEGEAIYVKDTKKLYDYSIGVINRWSDYSHRFYTMLNK